MTSKCPSLGSSRPCPIAAAGLAAARCLETRMRPCCICAGGKDPARVEDADADNIFRSPQRVYTHRTLGPRSSLCPCHSQTGALGARQSARAKLLTRPSWNLFPCETPLGAKCKLQKKATPKGAKKNPDDSEAQARAAGELVSCLGVRGFLAHLLSHSEGGSLSFTSSVTSREWTSG